MFNFSYNIDLAIIRTTDQGESIRTILTLNLIGG